MTPSLRTLAATLALLAAAPALGQDRAAPENGDEAPHLEQLPPPQPTPTATDRPGRVAESAVGRAGQRQTPVETLPALQPMSRISNRIANRVQSRIRNRIDRYYDPQANTTSPFVVAGERARTTKSGGR